MTSAPGSEPEPTEPQPLSANRDFRVVLAGQAVSALGDAISLTAMPLLVLALTWSGALMGIVAAMQVLPDLALGLVAGALADRWDRRRMMLWADLGRAVLTAAIPISFWLGLPTIAVILATAVPVNVLRVLSDAGFTAAIPNLVGRENLARGNSYLEATLSVPFIVGPALAGVLAATIGPATTIAIDAATFGLSAASLTLVRRSLRAEREAAVPALLDDIREGLAFVWRSVMLRSIIGYWSAMTVATASLLPALAYYVTLDRGLGEEVFGFIGSVWSVGYLAGSLLMGRLGGRRMGLWMLASGVVAGAAVAAIALTEVTAAYLAAAFLIGAGLAVQLVAYMTLRASATPDRLQGRVGSTARTISAGLRPLGLLLGGVVVDAAGAGVALLAMGGSAVLASVLSGLVPAVRQAEARVETEAEPATT